MRYAALVIIGLSSLAGCEKSSGLHRSSDSLDNAVEESPGASRRKSEAPRRSAVRFRVECFDVYAGCPAVRGLPALSADGAHIAIADTGPEDGRDEFVLSVRILAVDGSAQVQTLPVMTQDDRLSGLDPDTEEMSAQLRDTIERRLQRVQHIMSEDAYRPLLSLGAVHDAEPSEPKGGFSARFASGTLIVMEDGQERWRQSLDQLPTMQRGSLQCGPFPVAGAHVWVSDKSAALLAKVHYTSTHLCDQPSRYQAWR